MKWHADPVFAGDDRFGSKLPVDLEIGIVPACRIQNWDFTCSAPVPESPKPLQVGSKNTIPGSALRDFVTATSTLLRKPR